MTEPPKKSAPPKSIEQHLKELNQMADQPPPVKCQECGGPIEWVIDFRKKSWEHPGYICQDCQKKQAEELAASGKAEAEKSRLAYIKNNIVEALQGCGVPAYYAHCATFESFRTEKQTRLQKLLEICQQTAQDLAEGRSRSLFISGPPGIGKTHLAVSILRAVLLAGQAGRFENMASTLCEIKASWRSNSAAEADIMARTMRAPLLVLDDVGQETVSDWSKTTLYLFINGREMAGLPIIITSNRDLDQLGSIYTAPLADRIAGLCRVIKVQEQPSYRRKKR